jgi:hypothetical protein
LADQLSTDYKYGIIKLWMDSIELGVKFRVSHLETNGMVNGRVWNEYLALLTRLWIELEPGVIGLGQRGPEYQEAESNFMAFRPLVFEPTQFSEHPEKVYELEEVLRKTIDKLNITRFD